MQEGFGIRADGSCFYRVLGRTMKYPDKETITLPNGKKVKREVMKEYTEPFRDETPQEKGWLKTVKFEDILLLQIANPNNRFMVEKVLFHRVYEIDAERYYEHHKCSLCEANELGAKYHFLRAMEQGIYSLCWLNAAKFQRTASGPIQTLLSREGAIAPWVKMVSEKQITKKQAIEILKRLQRKPSMDVTLFIGDYVGMEVL
jgi:hypothetical protein